MKIDTLHYRDGYKVVVDRRWACESPIRVGYDVVTDFYSILKDGTLIAQRGYAFDFATKAFDTDTIKRASLAHDILCQAVREGGISRVWQPVADALLKTICLYDKMCRFRAWYVYKFVRGFQKKAMTKPLVEAHPVKSVGKELEQNIEGCA